MLKFDFKTFVNEFINKEEYEKIYNRKEEILDKFNKEEMTGWTEEISEDLVLKIKETAKRVKENFDCLVVIGIGGSFLGSYAYENLFKRYFNDTNFEVIYAGTTLSTKYLEELIGYLNDRKFCINVISKSGTTMETSITYKVLKDLLKRKYETHELQDKIIVTTDEVKGTLRQEVNEEGYTSFIIPDNIGGRYSFITPAHLLPLALNYDIDEIIDGYYKGKRLADYAYEYAATRVALYHSGKVVENYCVYEQNIAPFTEWLKQLFGETEGKNGVGIFPVSTIHTRDLHSLGQFIQEGNKLMFETFIKVQDVKEYIDYNGRNLHEINNLVLDSVIRAHNIGGVPCLEIVLSEMSLKDMASLIYFFQLAAAYSALLLNVSPFDQPGVEVYKKEVRDSLNG